MRFQIPSMILAMTLLITGCQPRVPVIVPPHSTAPSSDIRVKVEPLKSLTGHGFRLAIAWPQVLKTQAIPMTTVLVKGTLRDASGTLHDFILTAGQPFYDFHELPIGPTRIQLTAINRDEQILATADRTIDLTADSNPKETGPLEISLFARTASVTGTLRGTDDKPIPNVGIMIKGASEWQTMTDSLGNFTLGDLAPGDYEMRLSGGHLSKIQPITLLPDENKTLNLTLNLKARLSGVVRDEKGSPLREAAVTLRDTEFSTKTTDDGTFHFPDLPTQMYTVLVNDVNGRFGSAVVPITPGEEMQTEIIARSTESDRAEAGNFNDATGSAISLPLLTTVNGTVTGGSDPQDWWKVVIETPGLFRAEFLNTSNSPQLGGVELRNDTGSLGGMMLPQVAGGQVIIEQFLAPGAYYLVTRRSVGGTLNYALKALHSPRISDPEPNNIDADAKPLPFDQSTIGFLGDIIGPTADDRDTVDWWQFTLPTDGSLHLPIISSPPSVNMSLFSKVGPPEDSVMVNLGTCEDFSQSCMLDRQLRAGTYYVRVERTSPIALYRMHPYFFAQNIDDESGDDFFEGARLLKLNNLNKGAIGSYRGPEQVDATDWWKLTFDEPGMLSLDVYSQRPETDFKLYSSDGSTLIDSVLGGHNHLEIKVQAQDYYLDVSQLGLGQFSPYQLIPGFRPVRQDPEPNDDTSTTLRLIPGLFAGGIVGWEPTGFSSTDGVDYWRVDIAQTEGHIQVEAIAERGDPTFYLVNDELEVISGPLNGTGILSANLPADSYFVKVLSNGSEPEDAYTLRAKFTKGTLPE